MKRTTEAFFQFACVALSFLFLYACAGAPERKSQCTVAVWDVEDLSPRESAFSDIGPFMTARIMETLQEKGRCGVVERQKLSLAMEELNIGSSALADEASRLAIGRITGATHMIFGAFQHVGDAMRIDLRLVDVSTGEIEQTASQQTLSTDASEWLETAKNTSEQLFP